MSSASSKWLFLALTLAYLFAAHLAFTWDSRPIAATAVALLSLLLLAAVKGRGRRAALGVLAIAAVVCVARGSVPPLPLLLPPILVPLALAWLFGHTLLRGKVPLVERFARTL
ncbi:MAG: ketosynthase, partial [Pseudomonadota bacterium]